MRGRKRGAGPHPCYGTAASAAAAPLLRLRRSYSPNCCGGRLRVRRLPPVLFPSESVPFILARMIGTIGPIDMEMVALGQDTQKYFTDNYDLFPQGRDFLNPGHGLYDYRHPNRPRNAFPNEEAERLQREAARGAEKVSPEIIDVEATPVETPAATEV